MCAMSTDGGKSLNLVSCFISRETRKVMNGGGKYYKEYGMPLWSILLSKNDNNCSGLSEKTWRLF